MPSPRKALTVEEVRRYVERNCFAPSETLRVGVEAEWFPVSIEDERAHPPFDRVRAAAEGGTRLGGSALSFEPGGQIELSSLPRGNVGEACETVGMDAAALARALDAEGIRLAGIGLDPVRPERRVLRSPRYDAMEAFFDLDGLSGRIMMCSTAAVQVNLDFGSAEEAASRWRLAHRIGPTLAAAFANSPFYCGAPTAWRSARLATWWGIDRTRTAPADARNGDPVEAWTRYVLGARVMLVRLSAERYVPMVRRTTFEEWARDGHPEAGFPTLDDLEYHLTTLFPPVRARGWLELRMVDALPDPFWRVPVAVAAALLYDADAGEAAARAAAPAEGLWTEAMRYGLAHPVLAASAHACFEAALRALPRVGSDPATTRAVETFFERYAARARCPADDRLDAWAAAGSPGVEESRALEGAWT